MQDPKEKGRVLQTGHYAGLKFQEGWFFIHVLETEFIELKPWILMNEDNERNPIGAMEAGSEDDEIVDEVERKIVEPSDSERNLIYQNFIGVAPSRMQIYPIFGRDRAPNLVGGAAPGSPQVPMTGFDSPYNNPTKQGEIFTLDGMDDLSLQAYNPMDEEAEARISFHVNKIRYAAIDDVDTMRAFIQGQLNFRDHSMGLAAQRNEQVRAPGWLMDRFGDVVKSTKEIMEESESSGDSNGDEMSYDDRMPGRNGGDE